MKRRIRNFMRKLFGLNIILSKTSIHTLDLFDKLEDFNKNFNDKINKK